MTELQLQTFRAVLDCVIPADEFPGAWEAGVGNYLERQFAGDLAHQLELYCAGLDGLEAEANARFNEHFARLKSSQQNAIIERVESGEVISSWKVDPRQFFKLLVETAAEGYYSDPEQGGNFDAVSWTMTGFSECGPV